MQQPDAICLEHLLREMVGHLRRRLQIDFGRFLDERIDHVGLTALVQLTADELVESGRAVPLAGRSS